MSNIKPYWSKLKLVLLSSDFHGIFFRARLRANFQTSPLYRRLMAVFFTAFTVTVVSASHTWLLFIVAWVFPLSFPYQIAALLQFLSEHNWAGTGTNKSKSHGRFCGEVPPFGQSSLVWLRWFLKMLYHLWVRITVLPGELPEHDWHHNDPKGQKHWANGKYTRQRQVEAGAEYTEIWGLGNAIERVFQGFAKAPTRTEDISSDS